MKDFNESQTDRDEKSWGSSATNLDAAQSTGFYETNAFGERFRVNRVYLNPGDQLPEQRHLHHRKHWTVVAGTAELRVQGERRVISECMSADVPSGEFYVLKNIGFIPLELIEIQMGCYLKDDDVEFV